MKILNFFSFELPFNFEGRSKTKKWATDIGKGTLDIECERDRPLCLGAVLGDGLKIKKQFFYFQGFFRGKQIVLLLGFKYTINPENLIKIVGAIFEKIKIFNFFLMWTTLNFRGGEKTKKTAPDIYMGTLDIEFERDRSIGLGSTKGDGQIHIFRLWEWCRT